MQKYHSIQIQTSGALRRHWRPVALATALAAAVALGHAQTPAGTVQGTVSGVFGQQILLDTPEGQKLVNLPSGVSTPVIGARVTVDGPRNGNVIQARTLAPQETSSPTAATPPPLSQLLPPACPPPSRG